MTDPRPSLFVNDPLDELILDVWSALNASNDPPWLFRTGGFLSHLQKDDGGLRQSIDMLNIDKLRPKLAEVIAWWRRTRQGTVRAHAAPDTLTRSLLALPVDGLPALQIITESPVLLPDGTIVRERGYYASGKLVYDPVPASSFPRSRCPRHRRKSPPPCDSFAKISWRTSRSWGMPSRPTRSP